MLVSDWPTVTRTYDVSCLLVKETPRGPARLGTLQVIDASTSWSRQFNRHVNERPGVMESRDLSEPLRGSTDDCTAALLPRVTVCTAGLNIWFSTQTSRESPPRRGGGLSGGADEPPGRFICTFCLSVCSPTQVTKYLFNGTLHSSTSRTVKAV